MRKLGTSELKRSSVEEMKLKKLLPVIVVLDNVRSAYNVGSVFRTCDAFAVEQLFLCGITAAPPNREVMKTALGSAESVTWKYFSQSALAIHELIAMKYKILLMEQTDASASLLNFLPEACQKYALVFGNEINGISDFLLPLAHQAIEIPQFGTKHSFNISVSVGIVLWEFTRQLK